MAYQSVVHTVGDRFIVMGPNGRTSEYQVTTDGFPVEVDGGAPVDHAGLRADLVDQLRELRRQAVAHRMDRRYVAGVTRAIDVALGHR